MSLYHCTVCDITHDGDLTDAVADPSNPGEMMCLDCATEAWEDATTLECGLRFVPYDGECSCGVDLVALWIETGRISSTGCPSCHKSYVS